MQILLAELFGIDNWIFILVAALVLFGGKQLPELAKNMGRFIHEFKKHSAGVGEEIAGVGKPNPSATAGNALEADLAKPKPRFDPYTGQPLSNDSNTTKA